MNRIIKIGSEKDNHIVVRDNICSTHQCVIRYDKGNWILENLEKQIPVYINNQRIEESQILSKYDRIKIGRKRIYWSDFLFEGDNQEIKLKDIFVFHGRINRANFRMFVLLMLGFGILLYFLIPGLAVMLYKISVINRYFPLEVEGMLLMETILHYTGFALVFTLMLNLAIKRFRDTCQPLWKLLIPIENLRVLFLLYSKDISAA